MIRLGKCTLLGLLVFFAAMFCDVETSDAQVYAVYSPGVVYAKSRRPFFGHHCRRCVTPVPVTYAAYYAPQVPVVPTVSAYYVPAAPVYSPYAYAAPVAPILGPRAYGYWRAPVAPAVVYPGYWVPY